MFQFPEKYRVPFDGSFRVAAAPTEPPQEVEDDKALKKRLKKGSLNKGFCFSCTRPSVAILTTAGVTFSSIGARLGKASSPTACGSAACARQDAISIVNAPKIVLNGFIFIRG